MARYRHKDVESILKLFELELSTLNNLSRVEKMKIRRRVANAILPALNASNSKPDMFLNVVEDKLRDVFRMFLDVWGFRQKLHKQAEKVINREKDKFNVTGWYR